MTIKSRVLVAGGSGFLGSVISNYLSEVGFEVTSFDQNVTNSLHPNIIQIQGNLTNASDLKRVSGSFNVVINAAAALPLKRDASAHRSTNILGNRNLLEWSTGAGSKHFIYISSSAVYGVPDSPSVSISTPTKPFESYGISKLEAEAYCSEFLSDLPEVVYTAIRPRTIVGPGRAGIFASLYTWAKSGLPVPVIGDGLNVYQFVHPTDVAKLVANVIREGLGGTINLGGHSPEPLLHALATSLESAGIKPKFIHINSKGFAFAANLLRVTGLGPFAPYQIRMYGESLYFEDSAKTGHSSSQALRETFQSLANRSEEDSQSQGSPHQTEPSFPLLKLYARMRGARK